MPALRSQSNENGGKTNKQMNAEANTISNSKGQKQDTHAQASSVIFYISCLKYS